MKTSKMWIWPAELDMEEWTRRHFKVISAFWIASVSLVFFGQEVTKSLVWPQYMHLSCHLLHCLSANERQVCHNCIDNRESCKGWG